MASLILKLISVVLAVMLAAAPPPVNAACGPVQSCISSCFNWLQNIEYTVKKECCKGVLLLDQLCKENKINATTACKCIRSYYQSDVFDTSRADQILTSCNINISYQINPNKC
ncbi:hypothetical protein Droror1_Dr00004736 [Drosera rotundifolia]